MLRASKWLALALCLGGCSTLTGDFHQTLQIDALDAENRPVEGMQCQVGSADSARHVVTPATDVRVPRSFYSLNIECRKDALVATATVKSRREGLEEAMLPFGSAGVFVDHLSGALYAYPTTLHLRVGQHLVLEHGGEAKIAKAEPIPAPQPAAQAGNQPSPGRSTTAATQPSPGQSATAAAQPPRPTSKPIARVAAKPAKPAATVASAPKPRAAATQKIALSEPTSPTPAAPAHSAPVNW
jgi:hypothetical protein